MASRTLRLEAEALQNMATTLGDEFVGAVEKVLACQIAKRCGAEFVKTSTGFSTGGATVEDIALMRKTVGPDMGVKASGGIRDYAGAKQFVDMGVDRLGIGYSGSLPVCTGEGENKDAY